MRSMIAGLALAGVLAGCAPQDVVLVCKPDTSGDCVETTIHDHEVAFGYGYHDAEYGLSPDPTRGHEDTIDTAWEWSYAQGYASQSGGEEYDPESRATVK